MTGHTPVRVLIVDDEPGARRRLQRLLRQENDVEIVAQAATGRDAVEAIRAFHPYLVFLDVQMPGMTGLDVVKEIGSRQMPAVIFVTAYDQYAVKAFDLAAIDYLLKPFGDERFEQALTRARQHLIRQPLGKLQDRLEALLSVLESPPDAESAPKHFIERIAVEMRGQTLIVPVDKISYISSSGNYVYLHVGKEKLLVREQMQRLEEGLPPDRFFRIHRSFIVRLDVIEALLSKPGGEYQVRLSDGHRLKASRSRWGTLAERLGIQVTL